MKHDNQITEAFEEAFDATETATQAKVDQACAAVLEKAAEQFGPEGIYVKGTLDADNQGVLFRFKRPGIGQRITHFIECKVPKPKRKSDKADAPDEQIDPPETDRRKLFNYLANSLDEEDFTKSGKPDLKAINALLEDGIEPFTSAERDKLWDG